MAFDLKEKINEIVDKLKDDKNLLAKFQSNPIAVVEELVGIDLPDEQLQPLVDGIKAKLNLSKLSGVLGGLFGK